MPFDAVTQELNEQKKLSVAKELAVALVNKVVTKVELDPTPGQIGSLLKLTFGDGTSLALSMEGSLGADGGWYSFFVARVNNRQVLKV